MAEKTTSGGNVHLSWWNVGFLNEADNLATVKKLPPHFTALCDLL